ncbi:hypothetical protein [Chitinophaga polysaccharea]|uniref:hypothetical protein n=1 Tax=Chitinophaga polysaccharea TaxID=1293035 RepID=UPI001158D132|nr:hypothetical protein [Chitinophaga polysaccharea]
MKKPTLLPLLLISVGILLYACKKDYLLEEIKEPTASIQSKDSLKTTVEIITITDVKDDPALLKSVSKQNQHLLSIQTNTAPQ